MIPLNNVEAPDEYADSATLETPGAGELRVSIANQAVYMQKRDRLTVPPGTTAKAVPWSQEEFLEPAFYTFWDLDGVRFRAATKKASLPAGGVQARVTIAPRPA